MVGPFLPLPLFTQVSACLVPIQHLCGMSHADLDLEWCPLRLHFSLLKGVYFGEFIFIETEGQYDRGCNADQIAGPVEALLFGILSYINKIESTSYTYSIYAEWGHLNAQKNAT